MAGFGGSVKLTGESEYRKALSQITQSLKVVSSEMKVVSSAYSTNDADTKALANQSKQLTTALNQQKTALSSLKTQLTSMEAEYKKTETTHKALVAEYDKEKAKLAEIGKTLGTSSTEYKNQQKVVAELESEVQKSSKAYDTQTKALNNMRIQTANAETTVNNTAKALDKLGNEAEDAGTAAQKAGDGFTVFKGVVANLASSAIQKAVEGLKRLGSAMIDVGKQAVASQAEYEQLTGGVETLFKNSAKEVMGYADIAYKTAGMSANKYMETVTSFSASLLQGLGGDTAKAAKIADMAIIDMSDNANKMGTSMEMIQNAYQGFAKQNFTMLDNLKLGYGGTQAEMARLINETGVMGKAFKATAENVKSVPFDKMIEAIHQVQVNMGITGTTAKEASETISGSVSSMKAAWQNLLTGMANSQLDRKVLVKNFTDSIKTAAKNLIPTIRETIKGLVNTAQDLLNTLMGEDAFHFDAEGFVKGIEEAIKKVVTVFKWFVDNKDAVIAAINGIIAAFVVAKIVTFVTNVLTAVNALKTMVTATKSVSTAMTILNGTLAVNPFALVAGLVVGLGVALVTMANSAGEANKEISDTQKLLDESSESLEKNKNSWDEFIKSQQESINKGMSEMTYIESLVDELDGLVDANGKVQEGYEGRVQFITGKLAEALGIEIKYQDGIVQGYNKIRDSIDKLIEAKKAEIILNSQEAAYTEALTKRGEVVAQLTKLRQEEAQKNAEYWDYQWKAVNSASQQERAYYQEKADAVKAELDQLTNQCNEQQSLLEQYYYNISLYEDNAAKFHEGKYNEMSQVTWQYVQDFQNSADAEVKIQQQQLADAQTYYNSLVEASKKAGSNITEQQLSDAKKQIENERTKLNTMLTTTKNSLADNGKTWLQNSATVLSKLSSQNIEWKKVGNGMVQMYIDGVAQGKPVAEAKAEEISRSVIADFDKKAEAEGAGKDVITGFTNGTGNMSLQNAAFRTATTFAGSILSKLKKSLGIASPSKYTKQYGKWLLEGFGIGMEKEEDSIIKQATDFGDSLMTALNGSLQDGIDMSPIDSIKAAMPTKFNANITASPIQAAQEAEIANNSLINQFKEALSEMKIEMNDQEMGKFVDNTVTRLVYN